jgi:quercetin dioxygenase-like cupin family protein
MQVFRARTTEATALAEAVKQTFAGRKILRCGMAEFAPGCYAHEGEEHVHESDEVFVVLTGEMTVPITDGPSEIVRAGDFVLVAAGEQHHVTNHTQLPCRAMYLILD